VPGLGGVGHGGRRGPYAAVVLARWWSGLWPARLLVGCGSVGASGRLGARGSVGGVRPDLAGFGHYNTKTIDDRWRIFGTRWSGAARKSLVVARMQLRAVEMCCIAWWSAAGSHLLTCCPLALQLGRPSGESSTWTLVCANYGDAFRRRSPSCWCAAQGPRQQTRCYLVGGVVLESFSSRAAVGCGSWQGGSVIGEVEAGAAAVDRMSRRRPQISMQRRSYEAWLWPCMGLGWWLGDLCGQRVLRPGGIVFGQCEGRSGFYVKVAASILL
jgi:hypothetical protein